MLLLTFFDDSEHVESAIACVCICVYLCDDSDICLFLSLATLEDLEVLDRKHAVSLHAGFCASVDMQRRTAHIGPDLFVTAFNHIRVRLCYHVIRVEFA